MELHKLGEKLAIDDFGADYSSLRQLGIFKFDKLKIDRNFTRRVNEFSRYAAVLRVIVAIANNLGFQIIVEGIENKEQLNFFNPSGCKITRGLYFSKALPGD